MQNWVALFRGINVGGNHIVPMKILVKLMSEAGCEAVQSYIQSGNVVFKYGATDKTGLSIMLSELVAQHFGFYPKVMLLSAAEFQHVVANNPYKEVCESGKNLHVFFLETPGSSADLTKLNALKASTEQYHLQNEAFYLYAPAGIGRSTLAAKVDKCLGVASTARNLNTVNRITELLNNLS